jgi:hypothetical protein
MSVNVQYVGFTAKAMVREYSFLVRESSIDSHEITFTILRERAAAFQPKARPNHSTEQERIDYFEKKIQTKDEVLAELMAEHVALKKTVGEL